MNQVQMKDLLEAGMHFGHLTRRWNPKMKPYIYGVRNGIHIIDLSKTVKHMQKALDFITETVGEGKSVLFVGTKRQAQEIIAREAARCEMFYINSRWLGGTLTNFRTIKTSIDRLKNLKAKKEDGTFDVLRKKERLLIDREIEKLLESLGGIQDMGKAPGLLVLVDPQLEHIALHEANVLNIPVVALADTNCDPDNVDYLVPGNDDAIRSIELFVTKVADQILEGLKIKEAKARQFSEEQRKKTKEQAAVREVEVSNEKASTYVAKGKPEDLEAEQVEAGHYSAKANEESSSEASSTEVSAEDKAKEEV